jgi:hypothetical protein
MTERSDEGPLVIASRADWLTGDQIGATDVKSLLLDAMFT